MLDIGMMRKNCSLSTLFLTSFGTRAPLVGKPFLPLATASAHGYPNKVPSPANAETML